MIAPSISLLGLVVAPFLLVTLYGYFRVQHLRDVLDADWQLLIEFGAALRALTQSAGHDARALAAMVALSPDIEPLVFGFHPAAHPVVPPGIEPYAPPVAQAAGEPAAAPPALPREALFAQLENLPRAFDAPATNPAAPAELARLENLRGQIVGAEWLLQSEMQRLAHGEANLNAWLFEGAAGIVLVFCGHLGEGSLSARTRRRMLEADPRFRTAVRTLVLLAMTVGLGLILSTFLRLAKAFRTTPGT
jgi:hypothetical protein